MAPRSPRYVEKRKTNILSLREALRQKYGLPPFAIIFCCFNQLYKVAPAVRAKVVCTRHATVCCRRRLGAIALSAHAPRPFT